MWLIGRDAGLLLGRTLPGRLLSDRLRVRRVGVLLGLLDAVVGLQDVPHGWGRAHLAAGLESPSTLDHDDDDQRIGMFVRGPADVPVHEVLAAGQLAGTALAERGQGGPDERRSRGPVM